MSDNKLSYRQIIKGTSIFGGVQIVNIIIQVIRSKIIAVLLGPHGLGIISLLNTTISIIISITGFGLNTSAIKDLANACNSKDEKKISNTTNVLKELIIAASIIGFLFTILFSKILSGITFGNDNYVVAFIFISIAVLFNHITNGNLAILQGMRALKMLAKANLFGSIIGLIITMPMYFLWGVKGIVPSILLSSAISLFVSLYYVDKIKIKKIKKSLKELYLEGKGMVKMGILLSFSSLLTLVGTYIIRVFININNGVSDVGLYGAGFAILNTYVGMVFTAMGTDYYPRLSMLINDNINFKLVVNQQAEIATLILTPIVLLFLLFVDIVIFVLYSKQFILIDKMMYYAVLGILFKAASWSVSYIFISKGDNGLYLINEILKNIYFVILSLVGYKYYGLTGLGVAFSVSYLIYMLQVYIFAKKKYLFLYNKAFVKMFFIQLLIVFACFNVVMLLSKPYVYLYGLILFIISLIYSIREVEKRVDIKSLFKKTTFIKK